MKRRAAGPRAPALETLGQSQEIPHECADDFGHELPDLREAERWLPNLSCQRREDARPRTSAFVEACEVIFLVGRVHPIVVKRKADEE